MKVYISADIEGITGILDWEETESSKSGFARYAAQMTAEVKAACQGALEAGAREIYVKDAHDTGRNIAEEKLPENVKIIRGWSEHPFFMMQELDSSFHAAILIGYHSKAGSDTNPLAHTMSTQLNYLKLNGQLASEFLINAYIAAYCGVPVVFLSGDQGICRDAVELNRNISTLAVKQGVGNSVISIHPHLACMKIQGAVKEALTADVAGCRINLPERFEAEISFRQAHKAYRASFYPGVEKLSAQVIRYSCGDFLDFLKMFLFTC